jgi:flagellar biosynthesis/type III secretory pathway protein FliH
MAVEFLRVVVVYVSTTKEVTTKQVSDAISTAFKDDGGTIMSGFVQDLIEQGKQQGLQEGLHEGQQALRSTILDLLMLRFDPAPPSITKRVGEMTNLEELKLLARQAGTAESLTDFEQYLNTL